MYIRHDMSSELGAENHARMVSNCLGCVGVAWCTFHCVWLDDLFVRWRRKIGNIIDFGIRGFWGTRIGAIYI